jgi:hypothetical protein
VLTKDATRIHVIQAIKRAATSLQAGDIFMLYYSGHGGQLPDLNEDEEDALDETWCLYDGQLVDDELHACLADFAAGVRVLVLSDSCHSGTVSKMFFYMAALDSPALTTPSLDPSARSMSLVKAMPPEVAPSVYEANKGFYDPILKSMSHNSLDKAKARIILISGCQDNQLSLAGPFNSAFTAQLKIVWNAGKFKGNYLEFCNSIKKRLPPTQSPNYYLVGPANRQFESEPVFTI